MDTQSLASLIPFAVAALFALLWVASGSKISKIQGAAAWREDESKRQKLKIEGELTAAIQREKELTNQKGQVEEELASANHHQNELIKQKLAVEDELSGIMKKYSPIISIETEVINLKNEIWRLELNISSTRESYAVKRAQLIQLLEQIALYDDRIAFVEMGVYEPHFDFTDSEQFKASIVAVRDRQKAMISAGHATTCPTNWTVDGSAAKGQVMINRQTRLTMRAFNNECEAALANARWNNVVAMEKRILSASSAINKENTSMSLSITDSYIKFKIEELRLTHEYREKQKSEKEERVELARAEREEKKLLAEAEAAEREELKYQNLLDKARKDAETATGGVATAMGLRIAELEKALAEAHDASAKARAMAEMTKSGYVYIISNVGSFGDDVVKIGLTRRLDPDDRVRELGDASVPFGFDVHAMIYSDEAPTLEHALHREFAPRRINMMNFRKEFFRVSLDDVEEAVQRLAPTASFFKDREAQEWHETLARRNQALQDMQTPASLFPTTI